TYRDTTLHQLFDFCIELPRYLAR
ncbi:hypothetical protein VCHENC02_3767B, partial [Vibrio harveyi]